MGVNGLQMIKRWLFRGLAWVLVFCTPLAVDADSDTGEPTLRIALIIDDLGNHLAAGKAALALPGPVTYSVLPHTPYGRELAEQAHEQNKQIMLHLPMEAHQGFPLGEGGLTLEMSKAEYIQTLQEALVSVPHVEGINNHMGSLLTRDPTAMRWLMSTIRENGLFFIDSRTTDKTVAEQVAKKNLVNATRRDVFLDNVQDKEMIRRQFRKLIGIAKRKGNAVGIGHPYPKTVTVLAEELPKLSKEGVELVPASQLTNEGSILWHAYSSSSPKDAKNLKQLPSPIF